MSKTYEHAVYETSLAEIKEKVAKASTDKKTFRELRREIGELAEDLLKWQVDRGIDVIGDVRSINKELRNMLRELEERERSV